MIELTSDAVALTIDPSHGAEILELTDRRTGLQLLGRPAFAPTAPRGGDLDEATWTASYRGGWQLLAPNAGNACVTNGVSHGFHGRASVDAWTVTSHSRSHAELRWSGHGVELTRLVELDRTAISVDLRWTATSVPAPLIAVEHIVFGDTMLRAGCQVRADALAHELSEKSGPVEPPHDLPSWPAVREQDGGLSNPGAVRSLEPARAKLSALTGWSEGVADIVGAEVGVELRWDSGKLGAVWLWEEIRSSGGIWQGASELLGFELASVPHTLGLARAAAAGQAWWAQLGETDGYRLTLRVTPGRAAAGTGADGATAQCTPGAPL